MSKLLEILADCQPHNYEKLTALLSYSDQQLFEQIQQLQQQGLQIDTSFGTVKLLPQTALLDAQKLQQSLPYQVIVKPIIDSTNQFLMENVKNLQKGDLCTAEYQSAGRGRRGRQWISPFASQLIFSFVWQVDAHKPVDGLSLVIGMAISDCLIELGAHGVMLKWPNDILLGGKKLAGILIEIAHNQQGKLTLIIGVGINIDIPAEQNQIDQAWANLSKTLPKIDRTLLLISLIKHLYHALEEFEQQGISAEFQQKWLLRDEFFGEEVNVITEQKTISGIEQGINQHGHLQLVTNNGEQWLSFNAGEVSLRRK